MNWSTKLKLALLKRIAPSMVWKGAEVKGPLNAMGVHLLPCDFYANVPSVDDINASFEYAGDGLPYLNEDIFPPEKMKALLESLSEFAHEFSPPDTLEIPGDQGFCWNNSEFSHSDAMAYYCMIRHLRPKRILEVGSGFSTLIALEAMKQNRGGQVICIEPFPRPFLKRLSSQVTLIEKRVQDVSLDFFKENLGDNDFFFIDSTHTIKTGSDCLYLYLKIIPQIKTKIMIHAHDIFLPEGFPKNWMLDKQLYWTEQYLLLALLTGNPSLEVCFGSNYHRLINKALLEKMMLGKFSAGGGSIWFRRL